MKHKRRNYCQIHNEAITLLNKHNDKIAYSVRWLYICLNLLEHRFTGDKEDFFFRSIEDLRKDTGIGRKQIISGIRELEGLRLIQTWQMHWVDKETGKKSEKHITAFRILDV